MYHQRFRSAKVKEGESPTEILAHLMDMATKWLKEYDTRAEVIDDCQGERRNHQKEVNVV